MKGTLFERLLNYYGIAQEDFTLLCRDYDLDHFLDGHHFDNIEDAAALVKQTMAKGGKIMIYGDYDADGIMSTSILVNAFHYLNYDVGYYIPSRYLDGYGINMEKAQEIANKQYNLVITVDNGISAFEPIKWLKEQGIDVIVLDHHTPSDKMVEANYIIHPSVSHFGDIPTSAGFIAFVFSKYLLGKYETYLAILGAISVASDMMPLKGYNRNLLRTVFALYKDGIYDQIDVLKDEDDFNENTIGMKIAPRINAVGRIVKDQTINRLVTYFTSHNQQTIYALSEWIKNINELRKEKSQDAVSDLSSYIDEAKPAIVLNLDIEEGLLGLVANRLVREYRKPIIIFTKDSSAPDIYKGSCRAPKGFNVVASFNALSHLIVTSGGHALAGGLSVKEENYEAFKKAFEEYAKGVVYEDAGEEFIELGITELSLENYYLVQKFAPFGEEWPAPVFRIRRIKTNSLTYSKNGLHLLSNLGMNTRLVGFNLSREYVSQFDYVDVYGTMRLSYFRQQQNLEFVAKEIVESIV